MVAHRLVSQFRDVTSKVVTVDVAGARDWDDGQGIDVQRVPVGRDRRRAIIRLNAAAVMAARRFRPDAVLAMHIVAAPAADVIQRALQIPVVMYLHAAEVPARARLARFACRRSHRIVAVSRYTAALAASVGADEERVRVIHPGVDWHEPIRAERLSSPTIVTVARLQDRYKGHDVMVRAMPLVRARIPDAQWVVVGDGPLRGDIARLSAAHGVSEAVRLCGTLTDELRDQWLNSAHVFAMPSRTPANGGAGEGFGIAYLEAGVHSLPVVAGGVGGALDAVVDGTTGLLVDPSDHVELAGALTDLLSDPGTAARMGAAGSRHARSFAWPRVAGRVEALIAETVASR